MHAYGVREVRLLNSDVFSTPRALEGSSMDPKGLKGVRVTHSRNVPKSTYVYSGKSFIDRNNK